MRWRRRYCPLLGMQPPQQQRRRPQQAIAKHPPVRGPARRRCLHAVHCRGPRFALQRRHLASPRRWSGEAQAQQGRPNRCCLARAGPTRDLALHRSPNCCGPRLHPFWRPSSTVGDPRRSQRLTSRGGGCRRAQRPAPAWARAGLPLPAALAGAGASSQGEQNLSRQRLPPHARRQLVRGAGET